MKLWKYDLVDTRDDVKTEMPDGWKVEVYKVTSGDSGKTYYVQHVHWGDSKGSYFFCSCPEGIFRAPIAMTGGKCCKHAENLKQFLEERKKK